MAEMNTQLEAARAAKEKARALCENLEPVNGVGLTRRQGRFAVKILLNSPLASSATIPKSIDGIPVVTQVVGPIRKQPKSRGQLKPSAITRRKTKP